MASGNEIQLSDMPVELRQLNGHEQSSTAMHSQQGSNWQQLLKQSLETHFSDDKSNIIGDFMPQFERILITTALEQCGGKKQLAASRLGWGRNTLTRKLKELGL